MSQSLQRQLSSHISLANTEEPFRLWNLISYSLSCGDRWGQCWFDSTANWPLRETVSSSCSSKPFSCSFWFVCEMYLPKKKKGFPYDGVQRASEMANIYTQYTLGKTHSLLSNTACRWGRLFTTNRSFGLNSLQSCCYLRQTYGEYKYTQLFISHIQLCCNA